MDGKTLELEPNLRIIRLSTKEREGFVSLWQQFGGVPGAPQIATGWEECGIELVQEAPKQYGDQPDVIVVLQPQTAAGEQLDLVVAALRLHKAGMVSYGGTLTTSLGWDPFGGAEQRDLVEGRCFTDHRITYLARSVGLFRDCGETCAHCQCPGWLDWIRPFGSSTSRMSQSDAVDLPVSADSAKVAGNPAA